MNSNRRKTTTVLLMSFAVMCIGQTRGIAQDSHRDTTAGGTRAVNQTTQASPSATTQDFVQQMMEINRAEKAMAQLALQRASADQVKAYARNVIKRMAK